MVNLETKTADRRGPREVPRAPSPNHPPACRLCFFYDPEPSLCRRYPPAPTIRREISAWPRVSGDRDWCAEGVTITE